MKDGPWWHLDAGRINHLQQQSIVELVKRCKGAHFVDVRVRINGAWETYQADWIKHMVPRDRPLLAQWRVAARRLMYYADECASVLRGAGYAEKASSLEAKSANMQNALAAGDAAESKLASNERPESTPTPPQPRSKP